MVWDNHHVSATKPYSCQGRAQGPPRKRPGPSIVLAFARICRGPTHHHASKQQFKPRKQQFKPCKQQFTPCSQTAIQAMQGLHHWATPLPRARTRPGPPCSTMQHHAAPQGPGPPCSPPCSTTMQHHKARPTMQHHKGQAHHAAPCSTTRPGPPCSTMQHHAAPCSTTRARPTMQPTMQHHKGQAHHAAPSGGSPSCCRCSAPSAARFCCQGLEGAAARLRWPICRWLQAQATGHFCTPLALHPKSIAHTTVRVHQASHALLHAHRALHHRVRSWNLGLGIWTRVPSNHAATKALPGKRVLSQNSQALLPASAKVSLIRCLPGTDAKPPPLLDSLRPTCSTCLEWRQSR